MAREQPAELARLFGAAVDAGHQHPGEVHRAAAPFRVAAHGGGECLDVVARVDRNEARTFFGEGRRQGQDQPVGMAFLRVALDLGQEADGRDRDAVSPDVGAAGVAQEGGGPDHVLVVLEGLALALEHDAGDRPLRPLPAHREDLLHDLPGLEVAAEARAPGLAEVAAERAADLGGHADAPPRAQERDANRLEHVAVRSPEEVLHEGIDGAASPVHDLEPRRPAPRDDLAAEGRGEAAHAVQVVSVLSHHAPDDAPGEGEVEIGPGRGQALRGVAAEVEAHLEADRPALTLHLDLHVVLADVEDAHALDHVALPDEPIVEECDRSAVPRADGVQPELRLVRDDGVGRRRGLDRLEGGRRGARRSSGGNDETRRGRRRSCPCSFR